MHEPASMADVTLALFFAFTVCLKKRRAWTRVETSSSLVLVLLEYCVKDWSLQSEVFYLNTRDQTVHFRDRAGRLRNWKVDGLIPTGCSDGIFTL